MTQLKPKIDKNNKLVDMHNVLYKQGDGTYVMTITIKTEWEGSYIDALLQDGMTLDEIEEWIKDAYKNSLAHDKYMDDRLPSPQGEWG